MAKKVTAIKVEVPVGVEVKDFPADVIEKTEKMLEAAQTMDLTKVDETLELNNDEQKDVEQENLAATKKEPSKSDMIRSMYEEGQSVAEIAKALDSHYSFVYGVVKAKFGRPESNKGPSKSDKIREMADKGMTPGDIAKELNANYSFVHTVVKKHKAEQEDTTQEDK